MCPAYHIMRASWHPLIREDIYMSKYATRNFVKRGVPWSEGSPEKRCPLKIGVPWREVSPVQRVPCREVSPEERCPLKRGVPWREGPLKTDYCCCSCTVNLSSREKNLPLSKIYIIIYFNIYLYCILDLYHDHNIIFFFFITKFFEKSTKIYSLYLFILYCYYYYIFIIKTQFDLWLHPPVGWRTSWPVAPPTCGMEN